MSARDDEFLYRLDRVLDDPAPWQDDEALALLGRHWLPMVNYPRTRRDLRTMSAAPKVTRARKLLWLNIAFLAFSVVLWIGAIIFDWLSSVTFVSHVSMAALVMSAVAGIAAGDAAVEAES